MARTSAFTNSVCYGPNVVAKATANAVTANTAFRVEADQLDERTVFLFVPSAGSGKLVVSAGTGYAGVSGLELECPTSGGQYFFTLDSARYIIGSGEDAGQIEMKATVAGTLSILQPKV